MLSMLRIAYRTSILMVAVITMSGCVMSEEMKRIEQDKAIKKKRKDEMSTNLSGKQIFVRSCNTCHPGGREGMGPSLSQLKEHFPDDTKLKAFLRQGAGVMPPQPKEVINEKEMDNLIGYLRALEVK